MANIISSSYSNLERVIHSFKTTLACLIGFAIIKSTHVPFDQWLIVTIIVVMCAQINVGSVFQKSYIRFFGTLAGSLIATIALLVFHDQPWAAAVAVGFSAMLFSFIATMDSPWNDAGTLGVATTAIILMGQNPTIYLASVRTLEISLGILIAALISQFVLPIHARSHLRRTQAKTVKQLRNYYLTILGQNHENNTENFIHEMDEKIVVLLQAQRKLAKDSQQETLGLFNAKFFKQLLWCEKEILRSIDFLHQSHHRLSPDALEFLNQHFDLGLFNIKVVEAFSQIVSLIEQKDAKKLTITAQQFGHIINVPLEGCEQLSAPNLMQISGFLFFAKILTRRLREMTFLIKRMRLL